MSLWDQTMTSKIELPDGQVASDGDFIIIFCENQINDDKYIEEIYDVSIPDNHQGGSLDSVWIDEKEEKIRRLMYDDEISVIKDVLSLEESGSGSIWVRDDITIIEEELEKKYDSDKFQFSVTGRGKVAVKKLKEILPDISD